ncbi:MAG: ComF family protein [Wenzhouxiangellaceae bacterium]
MARWFRMNNALVSKLKQAFVNHDQRLKVDRVARTLWPPVCLVCGRSSDRSQDCCSGCHAELPAVAGHCQRCALILPRTVALCGGCTSRPPAFDLAHAAFAYLAPVAGLVQRFKFGQDLVAGRVLAELMAEQLTGQQACRPDLLIPVPLNWRRQFRRGFNQSELLCRDLSRHFGWLPWLDALQRTRATAAQSELPAGKRSGNVRGAFTVRRLPVGVRHVALIDDVMTTGATLGECARVLKNAGVRRVDAWVIARA